jgi:hypothetical protein
MSFNGSFGEGEFVDENNSNLSFGQDFKVNYDSEGTSNLKYSNTKLSNNNDLTINSNTNNIFSPVPMEVETDNDYQNQNNTFYDSLLSKEFLKYHISNLFNIIKSKIIIIKYKIFSIIKEVSNIKLRNLINAEILYIEISSKLKRIVQIFKRNRINILYQVFNILKTKIYIAKNNCDNDHDKNSIEKLEKEIKDGEKKIIILTKQEKKLRDEINCCYKKKKQMKDTIKIIENNAVKAAIEIIKKQNNSKYDSNLYSVERTIEANKQTKNGKEEVDKLFMKNINKFLNEYQVYINNLYGIESDMNNNNANNTNNININNNINNNMNIELDENINNNK